MEIRMYECVREYHHNSLYIFVRHRVPFFSSSDTFYVDHTLLCVSLYPEVASEHHIDGNRNRYFSVLLFGISI